MPAVWVGDYDFRTLIISKNSFNERANLGDHRGSPDESYVLSKTFLDGWLYAAAVPG